MTTAPNLLLVCAAAAQASALAPSDGIMSDQYDSPWKDILDRYFPQFMAFFFPDIYRDIDWSRGWEILEQELQQVVRDAESGKRFADKLVKVWRKDGTERYVVIHIEIQGEHDAEFPLRMHIYNYRLFDRHQQPIVSLAVLCDDRPDWRPGEYSHEVWGCRASLEFPMIKLSDYNERWQELEASSNPFATVAMSTLKARATRGNMLDRLRWKVHLVRGLYDKNWRRREVLELLRFIDWVLALPLGLEGQFNAEIEKLETEKKMRYITSFERKWLKQGEEQGEKKGEISLLKRQIKRRFDRLPAWVEQRLAEATHDQLETWSDRIFDGQALEDVFAGSRPI